jgi:hypothetical protein
MSEPKQINQILNQAGPENFDLYSEIELNEEEKQAALLQARQKKYFDNKIIEYKKKVFEEKEYPKYTPTELYMKVHYSGFIVDEFNKQIIWNMCRYFAGDPNGPLNLRKGLLLYGPVGCYKTALMKFFQANQSNSFVLYPVSDVSHNYAKEGHDGILKYKGLIPSTDTFRTFGQTELGICFDDFGTDNQNEKHYGNESNVMAEIILARHMSHYNLIGKTHLTTNINTDEILKRYGDRVKSRLREMVNLVDFPDDTPDRRI